MARQRWESSRPFEPATHEEKGGERTSTFFSGLTTPVDEFIRSQMVRLRRIAYEMGVPRDRIDHVIQDVWRDALQSNATFNGEHAQQQRCAWLNRVMRSKSKNALRYLKRPPASLDATSAEPVDCEAKEPVDLMQAKEREAWLAASLEELRAKDPVNGRLLSEHFLEGRSIRELADETGFTSHAIHCRIGRALKKLRGQWY
jgi:RNA polymerase sigma factor (sigma-70 family)